MDAKGWEMICPVCNNDTLEEGEYVHNGVGLMQCSPNLCQNCGYVQALPYADLQNDLPQSYFEKCWELQVWPWEELDYTSTLTHDEVFEKACEA